jgi:hypothetical protein
MQTLALYPDEGEIGTRRSRIEIRSVQNHGLQAGAGKPPGQRSADESPADDRDIAFVQ